MTSRFSRLACQAALAVVTMVLLAAVSAQTAKPQATTGGKATPPAKAAPGQPKPWLQIPVPPLPPFHPQQPRRIVLPNGMILFLQEDHELPTIDGTMRIRGGSRAEPAAKIGLVDMYGEVWRTGGTKTMTGDQMDDFLEARAAKVETDGGIDSTSISFSCLKGDFEDVFRLYLDLLRNPEFREEKLKLAKDQVNTGIARRNDDINGIAGREAAKLAYGAENPYARQAEYYTVAAVTRQDFVEWHQRFVHPNNIIMGIVGDFDPAQMETQLRQVFESWAAGLAAPKPEIEFQTAKPGVYFVSKSDVNQSAIRMVTLGIRRDNPDYFAVEALNEVLGGGFSSRLFSDIRTKRGLAYAVGGGIGAAFDHPGTFRVSMGTKSASTVESIKALREELQNMVTQPATEVELKRAKDSILNSFIFNFDTKDKVLRERMAYEFYGYPADFLERYRAGIEKVTTGDVNRVAQKYIHPQQFAVLVVGNESEFGEKLSSLGPVTPIDITIPTAPPGQQATPAASNPEGKALVAKAVEAMGGVDKIAAVKSLRVVSAGTMNTPMGQMQITRDVLIAYPDRMHMNMTTPQGVVSMVVTPADAFMSMAGMGVRPLPGAAKDEALQGLKRDSYSIAQHVNDPKYTFTAGPTETINGTEATAIDINAAGAKVRWWVEPQSGRVVRVEYDTVGPQGPTRRVMDMSEWKTVDGLTFAFKRTTTENGQPSTDEVKEIQVNPPVEAREFAKPAQ